MRLGKSNEKAKLNILIWEDSHTEGIQHGESEEESEEDVVAEEESLSSSELSKTNSSTFEESTREGRNRRSPL